MNEMLKRLNDLYSSGDNHLEITFPDAIPLNELFAAIDEHSSIRNEIAKLKKLLEDRSY